jgi:hypothetical protein
MSPAQAGDKTSWPAFFRGKDAGTNNPAAIMKLSYNVAESLGETGQFATIAPHFSKDAAFQDGSGHKNNRTTCAKA